MVVLLSGGLACAADLDLQPGKQDRPAPFARHRMPSIDAPSAPVDKPKASDDQRMEGLQQPKGDTSVTDDGWWQKLVRDAPQCKSFSDGCRTCSPSYVCSNIGIACQPKEWACNDAKP